MREETNFLDKNKFVPCEIQDRDLTKDKQKELIKKLGGLSDKDKILFKKSITFVESLSGVEQVRMNKFIEKFNKLIPKEKENQKLDERIIEDIKKEESPYMIFEKEAQAKEFIKRQPFFYDRRSLYWIWEKELLKWEIIDEVDVLNGVKKIGINTINSKEKTEILNALKQVGRESMPEPLSEKYIQFKNRIINVQTGEEFESTPKFFSTNPIPWSVGKSEETPTMDKLFEEWVGKKYIKTLYEIIAYTSCSEQFLQRMVALVGGGANGKGTFIKLLNKFIGEDNSVSSEMALLSMNQFETSTIYKKLLCEMGEVSYDDLKNTNQIKKLSGGDKIRYCFKGKTPFTELSPTTCIINTNSLPNTPDKTDGFYRKWIIIDFPNQFPIKPGLIAKVPDVEFNNLANKSIRILKELYKSHKFTNEGDIEERAKRYEERSNPIMRFIEECCEEEIELYIPLKKFSREINKYLKMKHLRKMSPKEIQKKLLEEGFEVSRTRRNKVRDTYIINLNLKPDQKVQEVHEIQSHLPHGNQVENIGTIGTIGTLKVNNKENEDKILKILKDYPDNFYKSEDLIKIFPDCEKLLKDLEKKGYIQYIEKMGYQLI